MIKQILELLPLSDGDSENIKIAKGKYYLPKTFKGAVKQIKQEIKWQK